MQTTTRERTLASVAATALFALSLGGALSCSSGGGGSSTTSGPTPTISLTLSTSGSTVSVGSSATVTGTLARAGGFTGDVILTVEGVPAGVTGGVSNGLTSGATSATVTLTVGLTTAPGSYTLTVRGRGTGVSDATASYTLTVTAPPSFTLALSATSANVAQGANTPVTITVARVGGFAGDVTPTLEGAPAGVTGVFSSVVTAGTTTATLTISVALTTTVGTYNLTVRGRGTGVPDVTAPLALTVTAAPSSYTLAVTPSTLSIAQNGNSPIAVTIGRSNYVGAVTLALSGAPTGVTGVFAPAAPTGTTSTLTLTIGAAVAAGQYTLTVRGTGAASSLVSRSTANVVDQTATITLTVTLASNVFLNRKPITVTASIPGAPVGYSVSVQFDHAALVAAGKAMASGNDVRVFYINGATKTELDRTLDAGSSWNSSTTRIWFKTQAAIALNGSDGNYFLYYNNPGAGTPPASMANIFLFSDDFESGNLSKWTQLPAGASWSVSAARSHNGASALMYPSEPGIQVKMLVANPALNIADVYVESWWLLDSPSTFWDLKQLFRQSGNSTNRNYFDTHLTYVFPPSPYGWLIGWRDDEAPLGPGGSTGPVPAPSTWTRVGSAMYGSSAHSFVNGVENFFVSGLFDHLSGNIGFEKMEIPGGSNWWIDDVIVRKYVSPEPATTLGAEQVAP